MTRVLKRALVRPSIENIFARILSIPYTPRMTSRRIMPIPFASRSGAIPNWGWNLLILAVVGLGWLAWQRQHDYAGSIRNSPPPNPRIYMLGDSLTYGSGADPGKDLPTLLAQLIHRNVTNGGIPGETSGSVLSRVDEVIERRPGTLIILLGGNDVLQKVPAEQVEQNLGSIIDRAQSAGSMVVVVGMNGRPFDGYSKMYARLAAEYECVLVPDVLSGIFFNSEMKADPIHPNSKGYALMAERIAERIEKYI